ncbi:nitronate monooxygenase [bacterium]|nr:nitronate monooxygenase [bacterium]
MLNLTTMPRLTVGDLKMRLPIVQGGMGVGVSLSGLAAAVANEGGVGVISAAIIGKGSTAVHEDGLRARKLELAEEIRAARRHTKGAIGVNILVALTDYEELLKVCVEEEVDFVFLGAGLPLKLPDSFFYLSERYRAPKIVPIVSSARATKLLFRSWEKRHGRLPDAVVVEGPMAGGHLGFKPSELDDPENALEKILPQVIKVVRAFEERLELKIPIIAAGGIYTGADIHRILELGADGVQMATRFVTTFECDASLEFKKTYLNAKKEDLTIIDSPVGLPGRAIKNDFLAAVEAGKKIPIQCPWQCLVTCDHTVAPYCIAVALEQARHGRLKHGFAFAGSNAWRADKLVSVKELIHSLIREYELARLGEKVSNLKGSVNTPLPSLSTNRNQG